MLKVKGLNESGDPFFVCLVRTLCPPDEGRIYQVEPHSTHPIVIHET